jgi:hypothetical protein
MAKIKGAKKLLGPVARAVGMEAAWYLPEPARVAVEVAESVAIQQSAAHAVAAATPPAAPAAMPIAIPTAMPTATPTATPTSVSPASGPTYYFDGNGAWLAYREGDHLFDAATNGWLGWSPQHNDDFAAPDGSYLCSAWHVWLVRADSPPWTDSAGQIAPLSPAIPQPPTAAVPPPSAPPEGVHFFQRHLG